MERSSRLIRIITLITTALILAACNPENPNTVTGPTPRQGVALFTNTAYVHYDATFADISAEASNLEKTLTDTLGHTVTTFTGITAVDFNTALPSTLQALVIPELEIDDLNADLTAEARTAIFNFVNEGGTLVVCRVWATKDGIDLINAVFGFALDNGTGSDTASDLQVAAATGTAFEGGPATIPGHNITLGLDRLTLPLGTKSIYEDADTDSTVTLIPVGSGNVVILGWDWYNAAPVGTEDGGWSDVLDAAIAP